MKTPPQKFPHPNKPGKMVSRQRIWQLRMAEEGRCHTCGDPLERPGVKFCDFHAKIARLRGRTNSILAGRKCHPISWLENKPDLSGADWGLPDRVIAKQYHTTKGVVYGYRKRHGIAANSRGVVRVFDFSGVDWYKTDQEISLELGCTGSLVCRRRGDLGIPRAHLLRQLKTLLEQVELGIQQKYRHTT